ncbi:MAG: calcium-binding protein [Bacillota bacterium]
MIETLESRALMDAVLEGGVHAPILSITGTEENDDIRVTGHGDTVVVDHYVNGKPHGVGQVFPANDLLAMRASTFGGNDRVLRSGTINAYALVFRVDGGSGNDTLIGRAGYKDAFSGGDGNDTLMSEATETNLHGGAGNDQLIAGRGENYLAGDDGNDVLIGRGVDILHGGAGNDRVQTFGGGADLYGEDGNDHLYGGYGPDRFHGGPGIDYGNGGPGNDSQDGTVERAVSIERVFSV